MRTYVRSGSTAQGEQSRIWTLDTKNRPQTITIFELGEDCFGSADALRQAEETKVIHESTRVVVFPGDLVLRLIATTLVSQKPDDTEITEKEWGNLA